MNKVPLVKVAILGTVVDYITATGASPDRFLATARLSPRVLQQPEMLMPLESASSFMEQAARKIGDVHFASNVLNDRGLHSIGAFGQLVSNSFTLYHAIQRLIRFERMANNCTAAHLQIIDGVATLERNFSIRGHSMYQADLFCLQTLVSLVRLATSSTWVPTKAWVASAPPFYLDELPLLPDTKVHFGSGRNAIEFDAAILTNNFSHSTSPDIDITIEEAGSADGTVPDDFVNSLRQAIRFHVSAGTDNIDFAANLASCSRRTLQRHLSRAGLTYFDLVDRVKYEEATSLIRNTDADIRDVAFDVGYSNLPNFIRAFKRWTGLGPSTYRRQHAASLDISTSPESRCKRCFFNWHDRRSCNQLALTSGEDSFRCSQYHSQVPSKDWLDRNQQA